jgi:putative ABC transport system permease protein
MTAKPLKDAAVVAAPLTDDAAMRRNLHALLECLRSALASVRAYGLRSVLTMLGIVIGVASVICMVALVQGLSQSVAQEFQGLGGNMLTLRADTPLEDELRGKFNRLRSTDLDELAYRIDGISNLTPVIIPGGRAGVEVRAGTQLSSGQVLGTTPSYQDVQRIYPKLGRFLADSDGTERRRIVVLGEKARRDLKLPPDPIGRHIQIGAEWFRIVGVMEPRGEFFGVSQDNYLLVPYETALVLNGGGEEPDLWISFTVLDADQIDNIKARVSTLMRQQHKLRPGQADTFKVESADALAQSFKQLSTLVTLVLACVVGVSLLVGGVGIMNIMLVSVTERTREIGIAKALGATRGFILIQFLIESVVLAVIGGLIGIVLGVVLSHGIAALIPHFPSPAVPWWAVVGAAGFSGLVGIAFGILPARSAANLMPIDALRHE